ncbi:delta-60 repeat domain-containing protein [Patulibacter minatonensis]|uniref:delta-60 repeat domain-containing protein n=1 Tax=Patulibacter minatonensis TaxID=298163 RepID=UPI00047EE697|nr:delta-60 repeat domain-containing protein [Patulibacter minatonensis]
MSRRIAAAATGALVAGLALTAVPSAGAVGLDTAFGSGGFTQIPVSVGAADQLWTTTAAPGGGTYSAGYATVSGTNRAFSVVKVDDKGKLDPSFGDNGIALIDVAPGPFVTGVVNTGVAPAGGAPTGGAETARGITVQPDGKILVLGEAETVQLATRKDTRDTDVYVVRLNKNGTRDTTFGTGGISRIDFSDGSTAAGGITGDAAAYSGIFVRPNGKIVFGASRGVDSTEVPVPPATARTDRDTAAGQLLPTGVVDPDFGTAGKVSTRNEGINENLRGAGLDPENGRLLVASYANTGGANRPYIFAFTEAGTTDSTFGGANATIPTGVTATVPPGVTTGFPAGIPGSGGGAEAYGVSVHDGKYLVTAYGTRSTTPDFLVDSLAFRFNKNGSLDTAFGTDSLSSYNRPNPAGGHFADRSRNHVVLPDQRFVTVGQSGPSVLLTVRKKDGSLDTSVGDGGAFVVDLGGTADVTWGVTTLGDGYKVVAVGTRGTSTASENNSALVSLDLSAPVPAPIVTTPTPTTPAPTPTTPAPTPTVPAPTPTTPVKKATTAGKVSLTCKRTGKQTFTIRCTISQQNVGAGNATVSLKLKGRKAVTGKGKVSSKGKSSVTVKTTRKGTYVATIKLPTPSGKTVTIKRTVKVK